MVKINELLRERRKELNLTMLELAKKVGVSEGTISRWESGDIANMRQDKIVSLAKALDITPAYLMGWEDYPFQLKGVAERELEKRKSIKPIENFNIRLEQALEKKNIKILELSQKAGLSENLLSGYLLGRTNPSAYHIYLLGKILEVSQDWLMGYDVPMEATYYSKNYELSAEEECIITIYRNLNKAGQDRMLDYSMELNEVPKYGLKN